MWKIIFFFKIKKMTSPAVKHVKPLQEWSVDFLSSSPSSSFFIFPRLHQVCSPTSTNKTKSFKNTKRTFSNTKKHSNMLHLCTPNTSLDRQKTNYPSTASVMTSGRKQLLLSNPSLSIPLPTSHLRPLRSLSWWACRTTRVGPSYWRSSCLALASASIKKCSKSSDSMKMTWLSPSRHIFSDSRNIRDGQRWHSRG